MLDPEQLVKLLSMVLRHDGNITTLYGVIADHAVLIDSALDRCARLGCTQPGTVIHIDYHVLMCDHCAAAAIMRAKANMAKEPTSNQNHIRARVAEEGCWIDLPDAVRIRRLHDFVELIQARYEPDQPIHIDQLH